MNFVAENCLRVGAEIIFIARDVNLIFSVNVDTEEIKIISRLPDEYAFTGRLGAEILDYKEKLIFVPLNARKINVLNKNNEWNSVDFNNIDNAYSTKFFTGVIHKTKLFLFGCFFPAIITIDLENFKQINECREPYIKLRNKQNELSDCFFRKDFAIIDSKIYLASCVSNQIVEFDMELEKVSYIKVGCESMRFSGIAFDGKDFWLTSRNKLEFYKWSQYNNAFQTYTICDSINEKYYLGGIVFDGTNLVLTGLLNQFSYIVNPFAKDIKNSIKIIETPYLFVKNYGEFDYCMTSDGFLEIRRVEKFDDIVKRILLKMEDSIVHKYIVEKDKCIWENNLFTLDDLLKII